MHIHIYTTIFVCFWYLCFFTFVPIVGKLLHAKKRRHMCVDEAHDSLLEYAATLDPKSKPTAVRKNGQAAVNEDKTKGASWRDEPLGKRIETALVKAVDRQSMGNMIIYAKIIDATSRIFVGPTPYYI